jgi:hydroxymethylbilane synthase
LVIGTRGSPLAVWQAEHVAARLGEVFPGVSVRLERIRTTGDRILDVPLAQVGGKALFVKEIEEALLAGRVDLAVHSMKDVPTDLPAGLTIGAIPPREDPADVLISRTGQRLADLPRGARVGTSSLRRQAQLLHHRADLIIVGLRGNLDTRIRKLHSEGLDAIVLAAAGVRRLGLEGLVTETLASEITLPAIGQGALGIEGRHDDVFIRSVLGRLDHASTRVAVLAERALLDRLEGGCQVPIAAYATASETGLRLEGLVASVDGKEMIRDVAEGTTEHASEVGRQLAERLLARGADKILRAIYGTA